MDCEKYQQRLNEYIDNRLPEDGKAAVEEHLSECADCREELDRLQKTVEMVSSLQRHSAPAGFADGVSIAIRRQESMKLEEPEQSKIVSLMPLFSGVAAAFLIALGIAYMLGPGMQKTSDSAAPRRMVRALKEPPAGGRAAPQAEGTPPGMGGMGGGGYGGHNGIGGYGGGYGGAYGGGSADSTAESLERPPMPEKQNGMAATKESFSEKMKVQDHLPPREAAKAAGTERRTFLSASKMEPEKSAVFSQLVEIKAPEDLHRRRPDRVLTLRAREPLEAVRQVVNVANKQQIGVQLRFVTSRRRGRNELEVAMEVPHRVYNVLAHDLAQVFGMKPEDLLRRGLALSDRMTEYEYGGSGRAEAGEPVLALGQKPRLEKTRQRGEKEAETGMREEGSENSKVMAEESHEEKKAAKDKLEPAEEDRRINFLVRVVEEREDAQVDTEEAGSEPK